VGVAVLAAFLELCGAFGGVFVAALAAAAGFLVAGFWVMICGSLRGVRWGLLVAERIGVVVEGCGALAVRLVGFGALRPRAG